jgi:hypothetical protein
MSHYLFCFRQILILKDLFLIPQSVVSKIEYFYNGQFFLVANAK